MVNYLLEPIYNKLKNLPEYQEIDKKVNDFKYSAKDMAEFAVSDVLCQNLEGKNGTLLDDMKLLVKEYCTPEENRIFDLMFANSRQDIDKIKMETPLGQAFKEAEYVALYEEDYKKHIDKFLELYETNKNDSNIKWTFVEYFLLKSQKDIENTVWTTRRTLRNLLMQIKQNMHVILFKIPYDSTIEVAYHDLVVRALKHVATISPTILDLRESLQHIRELDLKLSEYKYDYNIMLLYDMMFDIYFDNRDFDNAKRIAIELNNYINTSLQNRKLLMKGLNAYKFDHSLVFLHLIYKWRRIYNVCPTLRLGFGYLTTKERMATSEMGMVNTLSKLYDINMNKSYYVEQEELKIRQAIDKTIEANEENYRLFNFVIGG